MLTILEIKKIIQDELLNFQKYYAKNPDKVDALLRQSAKAFSEVVINSLELFEKEKESNLEIESMR